MPSVLRDRGHFSESPILSVYSRAAGAGTSGETPQNEFGRSGNVERDRKGGGVVSAKQRGVLCVFAAAVLYSIGGLCIKVIPWNGMSINGARTAVAPGGHRAVPVGHPPQAQDEPLGPAGRFGGVWDQHPLLPRQQDDHGGQRHRPPVHRPHFRDGVSAIFFRRRPGKLDLVTCAAVLGGILFFFVDSLSAGGMVGNVLALISGISYAGVFMMNDMPEGDAISSVFWGDVFSAVVGLPFVAMETDFSATAVVSVLILGVFQVALAYILLTIGLKTTPPVTASLVSRHRAGPQPHPGSRLLP